MICHDLLYCIILYHISYKAISYSVSYLTMLCIICYQHPAAPEQRDAAKSQREVLQSISTSPERRQNKQAMLQTSGRIPRRANRVNPLSYIIIVSFFCYNLIFPASREEVCCSESLFCYRRSSLPHFAAGWVVLFVCVYLLCCVALLFHCYVYFAAGWVRLRDAFQRRMGQGVSAEKCRDLWCIKCLHEWETCILLIDTWTIYSRSFVALWAFLEHIRQSRNKPGHTFLVNRQRWGIPWGGSRRGGASHTSCLVVALSCSLTSACTRRSGWSG